MQSDKPRFPCPIGIWILPMNSCFPVLQHANDQGHLVLSKFNDTFLNKAQDFGPRVSLRNQMLIAEHDTQLCFIESEKRVWHLTGDTQQMQQPHQLLLVVRKENRLLRADERSGLFRQEN